MQSPQQISSLLSEFNLERLVPSLIGLARPSVRLISSTNAGNVISIGASRIGGVPDVPEGWQWPFTADKPLSFIAQVNLEEAAHAPIPSPCHPDQLSFSTQLNLEEVPPYVADYSLPSAGLLSFFYESDAQPWGYDPKDKGAWRVFYFSPDGGSLSRANVPAEVTRLGQFEARSLEPVREWTVPDIATNVEPLQNLSDTEFDAYFAMEARLYATETGSGHWIHRLLGWPQQIQNDMSIECQLASNGVYCGDPSGYQSVEAQALAPGASDWRLLLQIDSDEDAGMMWGDAGRIYYWIHEQDLAARNFDAVWLVLQCG